LINLKNQCDAKEIALLNCFFRFYKWAHLNTQQNRRIKYFYH